VWSSDPSLESLGDLKGKKVLVAFWTTWCPFCKEAQPTLNDLQTKYADKPFVVLAISGTMEPVEIDGVPTDPKGDPIAAGEAMQRYLASTKTLYPIAMIAGDAIEPDIGSKGVPLLALLDSKGIVRATGLRPSAPELIAAKIDELLNTP
jgi:thiol-disulfide isomerase/thioredoxin